jgi:hypothetical protein
MLKVLINKVKYINRVNRIDQLQNWVGKMIINH